MNVTKKAYFTELPRKHILHSKHENIFRELIRTRCF